MKPLFIDGMKGLGDNIYQRPFIKVLAQEWDVHIATPWPELYEDLPVKFVHQATRLRTQAKNLARQQRQWHGRPIGKTIRPGYGGVELQKGGILEAMQAKFGVLPAEMDLPAYQNVIEATKPICLVRPATVRREWKATARNPLPEYIAQAVERVRRDFYVVSVADLSGAEEIALQPLPYADLQLHSGELDVKQLLGLIQAAELVIGGVGWIVPACIAAKTPLFCILGGNGAYNSPEAVTDKRMDIRRVGFAVPDSYCRCRDMQHNCNKTISNLDEQLEAFLGHLRTIQ